MVISRNISLRRSRALCPTPLPVLPMQSDNSLSGHPTSPMPRTAGDPGRSRVAPTEIGAPRRTRLCQLRMSLGIGPRQSSPGRSTSKPALPETRSDGGDRTPCPAENPAVVWVIGAEVETELQPATCSASRWARCRSPGAPRRAIPASIPTAEVASPSQPPRPAQQRATVGTRSFPLSAPSRQRAPPNREHTPTPPHIALGCSPNAAGPVRRCGSVATAPHPDTAR